MTLAGAILVSIGAGSAAAASPSTLQLIAHRGLSPGLPENTLAAIRAAIALGVDGVEVDVRATRDGHLVILHDATLSRTTDGSGRVADRSLADLGALDAGNDAHPAERIPTFGAAVDLARRSGVQVVAHVKMRQAARLADVVAVTEQMQALDTVIVAVESAEEIRQVKALNPRVRTLAFVPKPDEVGAALDAGADIIRLWSKWILPSVGTHRLVEAIHRRGKQAWAMVSRERDKPPAVVEREQHALVALGVDGLVTDNPQLLARRRAVTPAGR